MSNSAPIFTDLQKQCILDRQYELANAGNEVLLVHLGKTVLNQHDRHVLSVEHVPLTEYNLEELLLMLHQHLYDAVDTDTAPSVQISSEVPQKANMKVIEHVVPSVQIETIDQEMARLSRDVVGLNVMPDIEALAGPRTDIKKLSGVGKKRSKGSVKK